MIRNTIPQRWASLLINRTKYERKEVYWERDEQIQQIRDAASARHWKELIHEEEKTIRKAYSLLARHYHSEPSQWISRNVRGTWYVKSMKPADPTGLLYVLV
ncbi:MAG: hypothetical protein JRN20_19935 [Nitrososphaerota archaeon]|nr:hypothetical protein [Nitrososphaerota archaeon]